MLAPVGLSRGGGAACHRVTVSPCCWPQCAASLLCAIAARGAVIPCQGSNRRQKVIKQACRVFDACTSERNYRRVLSLVLCPSSCRGGFPGKEGRSCRWMGQRWCLLHMWLVYGMQSNAAGCRDRHPREDIIHVSHCGAGPYLWSTGVHPHPTHSPTWCSCPTHSPTWCLLPRAQLHTGHRCRLLQLPSCSATKAALSMPLSQQANERAAFCMMAYFAERARMPCISR